MTDHETDPPDTMFHDETKAREYFEALRWPDAPSGPGHLQYFLVDFHGDGWHRYGKIACAA
jgi:hypothetical protein